MIPLAPDDTHGGQGADPPSNTPEEFASYVKSEMTRWGQDVRSTGARVD